MIRRQGGFTLLELLVAIAIFALLGVGSYRLLASTIQTRDVAREHDASLLRIQKAFTVLSRDLTQVVGRPVRNDFGDSEGALILKNNTLEFSRQGWPNPLHLPRSEMQRIRYELNAKGELWRMSWSQLDRERNMQPQRSLVLEHVDNLQVKVMESSGQLDAEWPLLQSRDQTQTGDAALAELPFAVEIVVGLKPWGDVRRIFRLPESAGGAKSGSSAG